jgi:hypothetical protein
MLSTKIRENSVGKKSSLRFPAALLIPVVALIIGAAAPEVLAWRGHGGWGGCEEGDLEAKIIYETNYSDGDTGIQIFGDGERWKKLIIIDPDGRLFFSTKAWGSSRNFGWTELFSESYEPNWIEDLSYEDSVNQFKEGTYKFLAKSVEGGWQRGCTDLSRDIPCAPDEDSLSPSEETVAVNGVECGIVLEWEHVTNTLIPDGDEAECAGPEIDVETYQVIVEDIDSENEFSIFLEAEDGTNQVTIPPEFVDAGKTYKWEVLAIADNGNQTIAETYFCTGIEGAFCPEPED